MITWTEVQANAERCREFERVAAHERLLRTINSEPTQLLLYRARTINWIGGQFVRFGQHLQQHHNFEVSIPESRTFALKGR